MAMDSEKIKAIQEVKNSIKNKILV